MSKAANVSVRIEEDVKNQAEGILKELGIPISNAINLFYRQIIIQQGLPLTLKIVPPVDVATMPVEQLEDELGRTFDAVQAGKVKTASEAFCDINKRCGI